MDKQRIAKFQKIVWDFYKKNKRSFPWRETENPYHILVSEIMLQQTQTDRVVPYYKRWMKQFPNVAALSQATFGEIYPFWQGLGYNRRALFLKKAAEYITTNGWPENLADMPGVGPYTANAVNIFAYNKPLICIETNIRRVYIHHFFEDKKDITDKQILKIALAAAPKDRARDWHWALMDYGAYLKSVTENPNRRHKAYAIQSKFEGSIRQTRGRILKSLATGAKTSRQLKSSMAVLKTLEKEGLVVYNKGKYALA